MRLYAVLLLTFMLLSAPAAADQITDGQAAYDQKNYAVAIKIWQALADQGNADAEYRVGWMYFYGQGVDRDETEAFKWYDKAADQGNVNAVLELGKMYQGRSYNNDQPGPVKPDDAEAMKWYRKAADQGIAEAAYEVGELYERGRFGKFDQFWYGLRRDKSEAIRWYQKAAENGYAWAQFTLGDKYQRGDGAKQDYSNALMWYQKAAHQNVSGGVTNARFCLGRMYEHGLGVKQDYAQSYMWYQLSAGSEADRIAQGMTPEQIAEGKHLVSEWKPLPSVPLAGAMLPSNLPQSDGGYIAVEPSAFPSLAEFIFAAFALLFGIYWISKRKSKGSE